MNCICICPCHLSSREVTHLKAIPCNCMVCKGCTRRVRPDSLYEKHNCARASPNMPTVSNYSDVIKVEFFGGRCIIHLEYYDDIDGMCTSTIEFPIKRDMLDIWFSHQSFMSDHIGCEQQIWAEAFIRD